MSLDTLTFTVPGLSCDHCTAAVESELAAVAGVSVVEADLETKLVRVSGDHLDDAALRTAIEEAGYEAD